MANDDRPPLATGAEGEIRQRIVETDLVEAPVTGDDRKEFREEPARPALPLDRHGLRQDRAGTSRTAACERVAETLSIDARKLGTMQTRSLRVLSGGEDGETLFPDGR